MEQESQRPALQQSVVIQSCLNRSHGNLPLFQGRSVRGEATLGQGLCRLWPESAQVPLTRVTSHERQQRAIPLSIMYQYQSEEQSVSRPYRDPAWASGVCASSVDRCLADASCTGKVHLKPTPCNDTNLAYMLRAPALAIEARWPWSRKSFLAITTARQNVHCHRQYVSDQSATAQHVTHGISQPSLTISLPICCSLAMLRLQ